jgi:hypothetical protein
MAQAMLQAMGGDTITVVFPAAQLPNDPSAQIGLVDPGTVQVQFSPVIVRNLPLPTDGPRRRLEFLVSANSIADALISQSAPNAEALFGLALGVMYDGDFFHIENLTTEMFGGVEYLYRLLAVE